MLREDSLSEQRNEEASVQVRTNLVALFAKVLTDNVVITDMEFKVTLHPKPMPPGLRAKLTDINSYGCTLNNSTTLKSVHL